MWRVAEFAIPKYISLVNWLFWAEAFWETANTRRGFSEFPFSAWIQLLPKELYCHRSLFRAFYQSGKNDTPQEKKTRNPHHTQTNCHKLSCFPSILLTTHSSSPQIISSPLRIQYFGYLISRVNSLDKTLMLEKIEGRRRRGWQRTR